MSLRIRITTIMIVLTSVLFTGSRAIGQDAKLTQEQMDQLTTKLTHAAEVITNQRELDGVTALTILLIASFIVERLATMLLGLCYLVTPLKKFFLESEDENWGNAKPIMAYYFFAIIAATFLLGWISHLKILGALGFSGTGELVISESADRILTGLVIVIGAERLANWFGIGATQTAQIDAPLQLSGEMTLIDSNEILVSQKK